MKTNFGLIYGIAVGTALTISLSIALDNFAIVSTLKNLGYDRMFGTMIEEIPVRKASCSIASELMTTCRMLGILGGNAIRR